MISPDVLGTWLWTRAIRAGGRLVIAADGKTVRGAKDAAGKAPHLVAALAHAIGAVLGQAAAAAESNGISAVRDLLKAFTDLAGAVITIEAMHTQGDTAQVITSRGADYEMTVKGNMPTLYRQLKKLPWARIPAFSAVSTDHGRRPIAPSRRRSRRPESSSPTPPRSRRYAARSPRARRPSRSSTSSPATAMPTRKPSPPGSAATGR
jgi:predicted transposase YbfD/YdcC